MLAYTLNRLLIQQAVIERDVSVADGYGGDSPPDWQPHLTVSCLLWWNKQEGARSTNRTYVTPARTVPELAGGLLVALGTDVTELDRVVQVNDSQGNLLVKGVFTISAVLAQEDHMELNVIRAHLGA